MTLAELRAYLGFMSVDDIKPYIKNGDLPAPRGGRLLEDAAAAWDRSAVDEALTRASPKRTKVAAPNVKLEMVLAITPEQILAACELLDWSREQLSDTCGVPVRTIRRIDQGEVTPQRRTLAAIRTTLEAAGVEFFKESGGSHGVRLRNSSV